MSYYDDNFGHWDGMDDAENRRFYRQVQAENRLTECSICGREVYLRPHYDKCNSCCEAMERGW
jgi:hypothetical protein